MKRLPEEQPLTNHSDDMDAVRILRIAYTGLEDGVKVLHNARRYLLNRRLYQQLVDARGASEKDC